jgi:hypothetical protein
MSIFKEMHTHIAIASNFMLSGNFKILQQRNRRKKNQANVKILRAAKCGY